MKGFYAPETLVSPDYCGYKADVFSLGCVCMELLLSPDNFRLLWLSSYSKAKIVSKSYAAANSHVNVEFVYEIKTAIESLGTVLQDSITVGSDHDHDMLAAILNFHPGSRPSLRSSEIVLWVDAADEAVAYNDVSAFVNVKRLVLNKTVAMETVTKVPSKQPLSTAMKIFAPRMRDNSLSLPPLVSLFEKRSKSSNQRDDINNPLPIIMSSCCEGPEHLKAECVLEPTVAWKKLSYQHQSASRSYLGCVPGQVQKLSSYNLRRGATETQLTNGTKLSVPVKLSAVALKERIGPVAEPTGTSGRGGKDLSGLLCIGCYMQSTTALIYL